MAELPPNLTALKEHTEKLLMLLNEPELGLFTWWEFLGHELNEIAQYAPVKPGGENGR